VKLAFAVEAACNTAVVAILTVLPVDCLCPLPLLVFPEAWAINWHLTATRARCQPHDEG
jgi:hypothetical protein